uniref:basic proline-rich protein-like n=1 Tax=Nyctereutes procyonoides TaxID=34880 RepID=UPI002443B637|nr:basic proline-rich protein-like [Nyctereutes procyonoides]
MGDQNRQGPCPTGAYIPVGKTSDKQEENQDRIPDTALRLMKSDKQPERHSSTAASDPRAPEEQETRAAGARARGSQAEALRCPPAGAPRAGAPRAGAPRAGAPRAGAPRAGGPGPRRPDARRAPAPEPISAAPQPTAARVGRARGGAGSGGGRHEAGSRVASAGSPTFRAAPQSSGGARVPCGCRTLGGPSLSRTLRALPAEARQNFWQKPPVAADRPGPARRRRRARGRTRPHKFPATPRATSLRAAGPARRRGARSLARSRSAALPSSVPSPAACPGGCRSEPLKSQRSPRPPARRAAPDSPETALRLRRSGATLPREPREPRDPRDPCPAPPRPPRCGGHRDPHRRRPSAAREATHPCAPPAPRASRTGRRAAVLASSGFKGTAPAEARGPAAAVSPVSRRPLRPAGPARARSTGSRPPGIFRSPPARGRGAAELGALAPAHGYFYGVRSGEEIKRLSRCFPTRKQGGKREATSFPSALGTPATQKAAPTREALGSQAFWGAPSPWETPRQGPLGRGVSPPSPRGGPAPRARCARDRPAAPGHCPERPYEAARRGIRSPSYAAEGSAAAKLAVLRLQLGAELPRAAPGVRDGEKTHPFLRDPFLPVPVPATDARAAGPPPSG